MAEQASNLLTRFWYKAVTEANEIERNPEKINTKLAKYKKSNRKTQSNLMNNANIIAFGAIEKNAVTVIKAPS